MIGLLTPSPPPPARPSSPSPLSPSSKLLPSPRSTSAERKRHQAPVVATANVLITSRQRSSRHRRHRRQHYKTHRHEWPRPLRPDGNIVKRSSPLAPSWPLSAISLSATLQSLSAPQPPRSPSLHPNVTTTAGISTNRNFKELLSWLSGSPSFKLDHSLTIRPAVSPQRPNADLRLSQGHGLFHDGPTVIPANTLLIHIPNTHILTLPRIHQCQEISRICQAIPDHVMHDELLWRLFLMVTRIYGDPEKDFWVPYVRTIPDEGSGLRTPITCPERFDVTHTSLDMEVKAHIDSRKREFETVMSFLAKGAAMPLPSDNKTWNLFAWADAALWSRNIGHKNEFYMVPLVDMLNHSPDHYNVEWTFDDDDHLAVRSTRDIAPGEHLLANYGEKPNHELLKLYGFAIENNPADYVMLEFENWWYVRIEYDGFVDDKYFRKVREHCLSRKCTQNCAGDGMMGHRMVLDAIRQRLNALSSRRASSERYKSATNEYLDIFIRSETRILERGETFVRNAMDPSSR